MGKRLKVAIIGCGLVSSKKHIPALLNLKSKAQIVAVCDLNKDLAAAVAKKFGIQRIYADLAEMILKESPDVVDICTPPQTHVKLAVEAIENGCHVMIEKPMALTVRDCDEMIKASEQYNKQIGIIHNQLFNPAFLKAKKIFLNGEIGDLVSMNIFLSTPSSYMTSIKDHWAHKLPGGVLGETGPHSVYLALSILRGVSNINIVAKKLINEFSWSNFEDFKFNLIADNGICSVTQSYGSNQWLAQIDILGTEGLLKVDLQTRSVIKQNRANLKPANLARSVISSVAQACSQLISNVFSILSPLSLDAHTIGINEYLETILGNKQFTVPAYEGRETVRIMEVLVSKLNSMELIKK
ncbi:MAG: hypothetical protein A3B68_07870 [Candidatus Melainabacteria bacterium RIFCSPHIGHO2_02_FULL_34_12]|nr:MAG: hypothetical protein A3B68_07870 [Candidatus Melainabacteria bacterium RIFCSPHIGHO2_02_FULL_34_12]